MLTAPPGAEGMAGASPETAGSGGSTFTEDGIGFFAANALSTIGETSATGALAVPAFLSAQPSPVRDAASSALIFFRTSRRRSPRRSSTLLGLSGRVRTTVATVTMPKLSAAQRKFPGEKPDVS